MERLLERSFRVGLQGTADHGSVHLFIGAKIRKFGNFG